MTEMADKWNINEYVSSLTRSNQEQMKQALIESMEQEIEHELVLKRGGRATAYVRTTERSEAISHNYMIMKSLQIATENGGQEYHKLKFNFVFFRF